MSEIDFPHAGRNGGATVGIRWPSEGSHFRANMSGTLGSIRSDLHVGVASKDRAHNHGVIAVQRIDLLQVRYGLCNGTCH